MQQIFIQRPYQFVPPVKANWIPRAINNPFVLRPLLRFTESIVRTEVRGGEKLKRSLDAGEATMLIPNHPRTSDPVVMYRLLQDVRRPMFVMASWHLFNQNWFDSFAIPVMGGFSVNREGFDKTSISFAVSALQAGYRPLLAFPEGATSRTNDALMPFLNGPTFIARTAARRRAKSGSRRTVIHPIAIRYLFDDDFESSFEQMLGRVEKQLGHRGKSKCIEQRLSTASAAIVQRRAEQFEAPLDSSSSLFQQQQQLAEHVLSQAETRWFNETSTDSITIRIRNLRAKIFPEILSNDSMSPAERKLRWRDLERTYLAWQLASYPENYVASHRSVDRVLEIAAKLEEDLTDQPRKPGRHKVIIQVGDAIEVPPEKHRGAEQDPLMASVQESLLKMMSQLQTESRLLS